MSTSQIRLVRTSPDVRNICIGKSNGVWGTAIYEDGVWEIYKGLQFNSFIATSESVEGIELAVGPFIQ